MEVLPQFELLKPQSVEEAMAMAGCRDGARFLAGGTDLIVNLRRGIGEADVLIDLSGVDDLAKIARGNDGLSIGAGVRLSEIEHDAWIKEHYPAIAQAAAEIAGPTHRRFATVGGNLCLDTRCIYYNQSHWWRQSNEFCLKYRGEICHVAPKSKVCFAAFSGDLAPALLIADATVTIADAGESRTIVLQDLYVDDGAAHLALPEGAFVLGVDVPPAAPGAATYRKVRVRDSIDFPLVGVAVRLHRDGDRIADLALAFTGTNPFPLRVSGLDAVFGKPLDADTLQQIHRLANKQIKPMKSTFSPSTYRRAVATKLAAKTIEDLWAAAD